MTKALYPAPVYVGKFADGQEIRMSYWSPAKGALRQEAARRMVCQCVGYERARAQFPNWINVQFSGHEGASWVCIDGKWRCEPAPAATDIIAGHTERKDPGHEGEIIPDPYFDVAAVPVVKRKGKLTAVGVAAVSAELAAALARIAELEEQLARTEAQNKRLSLVRSALMALAA